MKTDNDDLLIGVDGGGSGCRIALARRDGTELARATGGQANVTTDGAGALANVRAALGRAAEIAGVDAAALARGHAHIGLAGVVTAANAESLRDAFDFALIEVTDDRPAAVVGALGPRDGILLMIGTGTIVAAQTAGAMRWMGGYGFQVSDQASGAWMGRALLEEVLLAYDGLETGGALCRQVLAQYGGTPAGIVHFARHAATADFAALARQVLEQPEDPTARRILARGAAYLNKALQVLDPAPDAVICLAGGIGPHYAPYIGAEYQARLVAPSGSALDGALMLAARLRVRRSGG